MPEHVAYVVKRYPRFSETFIVNEILAHEAAGLSISIYSLRPPVDTHFQDLISRVRAPLTYLSDGQVKAADLWSSLHKAHETLAMKQPSWQSLLSWDSVLDAYCGIQLAIHCTRNDVTHIHAHFASSAATVASIASALTGIPYSITAHAKDIFHESVNAQELERKFQSASKVFTVSDFNLAFLGDAFPTISDRFVRLYNGMHLNDFPFHNPLRRPPEIVAVGRFVEKKGFADLVRACELLKLEGVAFHCRLIGGGELEGELRNLVRGLGLESHVELLGSLPQHQVKRHIQASAVMAAPCIHGADGNRDGLPTVLLEAMALGTPCVSTDVTGIPEVVQHGETGLLVSQRSPSELASAIRRLLSSGSERETLATKARMLIERDFDIRENAHQQRNYFRHAASVTPSLSPALEAAGA